MTNTTTRTFESWGDIVEATEIEHEASLEEVMADRRRRARIVEVGGVRVTVDDGDVVRIEAIGDRRPNVLVEANGVDVIVRETGDRE